jgi:hypothetical protein
MHLKEAKVKNKLEHFFKERERTHPRTSHPRQKTTAEQS